MMLAKNKGHERREMSEYQCFLVTAIILECIAGRDLPCVSSLQERTHIPTAGVLNVGRDMGGVQLESVWKVWVFC